MSIKVSVIAPNVASLQRVSTDMAAAKGAPEVQTRVGNVDAICLEVLKAKPDLLVAELPAVGQRDLQLVQSALTSQPSTTLILLTPDRSPDLLLGAMRAG